LSTDYEIQHGHWAGTVLRVGCIPRQHIDQFIARHPEPEPPTRTAAELGIEVFGDVDERIPDHGNAEYLAAKAAWGEEFGTAMMSILAGAITIAEDTQAAALLELEEMRALSLIEGDGAKPSLLLYTLLTDPRDLGAVVDQIFYNSTVTLRGLVEAAQAYGIRWRGSKVPVVTPPRGPAKANGIYSDRQAAQWAHYRWHDFCELSGSEQSAIVALHRYTIKLDNMAQREASRR